MKKSDNTIKIMSKWMNGEANGTLGILAFVVIVGMICLTVVWA